MRREWLPRRGPAWAPALPGTWTLARRATQAAVVALVAWLGYRHATLGGGPDGARPLDAFCPFGAIENLPALLAGDGLLRKTALSGFVVFGAVLVTGLVSRASFCGWLCPLGAVTEWVHRIGRGLAGVAAPVLARVPGGARAAGAASRWARRRTLVGRRLSSSSFAVWDRRLRFLRYVVLALILLLTARAGTLVFEGYDPFKAVFHFKVESAVTVGILGGLLVTSLAVERFWCRYLCPLGAVVSLAARFSPAAVGLSDAACSDCGRCTSRCGLGLDLGEAGVVASGQCTLCGECVTACGPEPALSVSWRGRSRQARGSAAQTPGGSAHRARPLLEPLAGVAIFVGIIALAMVGGVWETRAAAGGAGKAVAAEDSCSDDGGGTAAEGPTAQEPGSDYQGAGPLGGDSSGAGQSIKGRMTAEEVAATCGVPVEEVLRGLGAPPDADGSLTVKVLAETYGGSVADLRETLPAP